MQLRPGAVDEYRRRHDAIWPELAGALSAAGIHDYWIFLDEPTLALFAVLKVRDGGDGTMPSDHPVLQRWWDAMAPLMEVEPGNRPKEWPLTPVFHLP